MRATAAAQKNNTGALAFPKAAPATLAQSQAAQSAQIPATGIGLAIRKRSVKRYGERI